MPALNGGITSDLRKDLGYTVRELSVTDRLLLSEARESEVPRWVQIPIGLVLALLTLLCGFAAVNLLFPPNKKSPILSIVIGLTLLLCCFWVLEKCFRLLTGRKNRGGLMSPNTLRVVSLFWLLLPVAGLFTGYYREMGPLAIFQAVMYFFGFLRLRALVRKRDAFMISNRPRNSSHYGGADHCE